MPSCPNPLHTPGYIEVRAFYSEAELVLDGTNYRCLGCGWLVSPAGTRVHEQYWEDGTQQMPAHKVGEKPGD